MPGVKQPAPLLLACLRSLEAAVMAGCDHKWLEVKCALVALAVAGSSGSINTLWQVVAELLPPSASQDLLSACLQRQAGAGGWWPYLAPLLSAKIKHVKLDQQHAVSGDTSQHLAQVSIIIAIYNE